MYNEKDVKHIQAGEFKAYVADKMHKSYFHLYSPA